ncbi:extracellular calcium-sensing receptor-like [Mantella aurantiaca]
MTSFLAVIVAIISFQLIPAINAVDGRCRLDITELEGVSQPGEIMIGAMLPIHLDKVYQRVSFTEKPPRVTCTMFHFENYQQLQALIFSINEINENPNVLSNVTLGFQAYDSCSDLHLDLKGSLQVLTGQSPAIPNYRCLNDVPLSSIIGASISTHSIAMAHILGLYRYPQVSHFSTSPLLSDRVKFPSFFRTVPSDTFQSKGLAELVFFFGWTWVGLLALDNDYGQQGIQLVRKEIAKAGACVAFMINIQTGRQDRNAPGIVAVMKKSTAKVIVVFSDAVNLLPVLDEMLMQNVTDKILVASEAWSTSSLFAMPPYSNLLSGTVGVALYSGTIPGFKDFLNKNNPSTGSQDHWVKDFWERAFNCKFMGQMVNTTDSLIPLINKCTGNESLEDVHNSYNDVSSLRVTYNVYTAVHVIVGALEDLRSCNTAMGPFSRNICEDVRNFKPWQLLHYMRKVTVKLSNGGELYFDQNGDPPAVYDIVNWQLSPEGTISHLKIGSYDSTRNEPFTIDSKSMVPRSTCSESCLPGFRKVTIQGQPVCCFQCVPCPQGEISNQTDSLDCSKCPWDQWPASNRSICFLKNIEYLSYEDPLGAALAFISIVSFLVPVGILRLFSLYKTSPIIKANNYFLSCLLLASLSLCFLSSLAFIGYPRNDSCFVRQTMFGMVFTLCISCILAKTITVIFAFTATKPATRLSKWVKPQVTYIIVFFCSFLQFILCASWLTLSPPYSQYNLHEKPGAIIVECNESSPIAFWTMLGYLFLLATKSFFVAFLARRLPNTFNEAKLITFSMLAFISVWVSFIPAYLSSSGKYTVGLEIFAIQSSTWALIVCIFLPKCFIVLWRPVMNSRDPPYSQYNLQQNLTAIIVECNESSPIAFWTMLGYIFLFTSKSFVVTFLARRLPNTFNETKLIIFSKLAFLSIWISFIAA